MGSRARMRSGTDIRPLHLAVEQYVRCPRGGLVRIERCEVCDLMQGSLNGERLEILCAYPEPVPALHLSADGEGSDGTQGAPAPQPATVTSRAAVVAPTADADGRTRRASALIFESDWPDD